MSILFALLLAVQTPQGAAIAGNYTATSQEGAECALVLMPPARRPQGAMALMGGAAGLAAAAPDCELALADAMFWQFEEEESRLVLVDAAGDVVFAGAQDGQAGWTGLDPQGGSVRLSRNR